jgi:hypothetical protein
VVGGALQLLLARVEPAACGNQRDLRMLLGDVPFGVIEDGTQVRSVGADD